MYKESLEAVGNAAVSKTKFAKSRPLAYLVHAAMAGAYVGLGIVLIFAFGTPLAAAKLPFVGLVMAATFGIALSLVIIAGADLFTGNAMVMPVGALNGQVKWRHVALVWLMSYVGNFFGSILVGYLAAEGGVFYADPSFVLAVAAKKMTSPFSVLFVKAMLCNWLVVLAVWSAYRAKSESGKLIMIWWCLLAFIGSGYEHSIANMTLLSMANFLPHDGTPITWAAMIDNLVPVTLGNIVSGAVFMGLAYWYVSPTKVTTASSQSSHPEVRKAS